MQPMNTEAQQDTYAAIDLGSNSFHLLVVRRDHGELRVLDRIKEMVRLGGGLDEEGNLDPETRKSALDCLARFGQRLRGIPANNMRAVGTQTFRRLKNANEFLLAAEQMLECPIDIISGREEARLIYLGVTQWVEKHTLKQLVMDIGGGSTELIIGEGLDPVQMESMQFGCVSTTQRFFPDGQITQKRLRKAQRAVAAELQEIQSLYRKTGWQKAIGSSGTLRSAANICVMNGWSKKGITKQALLTLKAKALSFKRIEDIEIKGLMGQRQPVFIGGLAVILACFEALNIDELVISPYALREGLLQDLIGRLEHKDPRDQTVKAFMTRFAVDEAQVDRVQTAALKMYDQLTTDLSLVSGHRKLLTWASGLHELGLSLSHSSYQQHSAYLVDSSDMAGFSRQEQLYLATLVGYQRREIPAEYAAKLPERLWQGLNIGLVCLRLAWVFCRTRDDESVPDFRIKLVGNNINLALPADWMETHPLTIADLGFEQKALQTTGLNLQIMFLKSAPVQA
jgi:exopolyphosphatase/guanosine-5'-triphosphate,3'-diphosphate pyrophosphatase